MNQPPALEADILEAKPPPIARAAGGVVLAAGALAVLVGVQAASGFGLSDRATVFVGLLFALGGVTGAVGLMLMRARSWAPVAAIVASALLLLLTGLWLVNALASMFFSLFALGAPLFAFGALVMSVLSVGPCRRVAEARARLAAQGLDLGT